MLAALLANGFARTDPLVARLSHFSLGRIFPANAVASAQTDDDAWLRVIDTSTPSTLWELYPRAGSAYAVISQALHLTVVGVSETRAV